MNIDRTTPSSPTLVDADPLAVTVGKVETAAVESAASAPTPPVVPPPAAPPTDPPTLAPLPLGLAHTLAMGLAPTAAHPAVATSAPKGAVPPSGKDARGTGAAERLRRLGRYVLLRELGKGGMGVVYAAYDEELDRRVALKLLHEQAAQSRDQRSQIIREAQALARVSAPNVVHVYDVGELSGQVYIAMEFVNGTTLTQWQQQPGRTWQEVLRMYLTAGEGLCAVHQAGLVHRDFKADNVLIGEDGRPRVADFGLALSEQDPRTMLGLDSGEQAVSPSSVSSPAEGASEGVILGTPLYMSPEQHMGKTTDARSDQFSFCVALYEALYQQLPFAGKTLAQLRYRVLTGEPLPPPVTSNVPRPIRDALLRGLRTDPGQRFASMRELLGSLNFDASVDPAAAPMTRRWLMVGALCYSVFNSVALSLLRKNGMGLLSSSLLMSGFFIVFLSSLAVGFRRSLLSNSFHRGMVVLGISVPVQLAGLRILGMMLELPFTTVLTLDLLVVTICSGQIATLFLPWLWPLVPITLGGALVASHLPEHALRIASILVPGFYLITMLLWNHAGHTSQRQRRTAPKTR